MLLKEYFKYLLILIPLLFFMNDVDEEHESRKIVDSFNKYYKVSVKELMGRKIKKNMLK